MRTEEEKQMWKARMSGIAKAIKKMEPEEREQFAKKSPIFTCEGHILACYNTCSLLMQSIGCEEPPTQIGGFKQWQKIGRKVSKGEHSIGSIMVPMGVKKDSDGQEDDSDIRFRHVPVFDVTQTETLDKDI